MDNETCNTEAIHPQIAGFWKRIFAVFIDLIMLGILGYVLSLFLEDWFIEIGQYGRFIGMAITLIYFGYMNSKLGQGQSIGKRILGLQVVHQDGGLIEFKTSILRAFVLSLPFTLNGMSIEGLTGNSLLMYPLCLIIFGGMSSIIYLYLCNSRTRQSLHDLISKTYVVSAEKQEKPLEEVWNVHKKVVLGIALVTFLIPAVTGNIEHNETFEPMIETAELLQKHESVRTAGIFLNTTTFTNADGESNTTTSFTLRIQLYTKNVSDVEFANELGKLALENYPNGAKQDAVFVELYFGYDIGIWSYFNSHKHQITIENVDTDPRQFIRR